MLSYKTLGAYCAIVVLSVSACSPKNGTYREIDNNPDTDWFYEAKIGAFMHFLPDSANFDLVDKFDVVALADQLEDSGVKFFEFTLGQNSGYYNAPNPVYDEISGYKPGEKTAIRDLPMEIGLELKKRGISFMLYLPCQTPNRDPQAIERFGFNKNDPRSDKNFTETGVYNWAKVIAWWSKHYGDLVKGWWFDGGYTVIGFNWAVGTEYAKAVKSGNPHAIVAFNPGVKKDLIRHCKASDYTAGEIAGDLLNTTTPGRWVEGAQAHVLTYLGDNWGSGSFGTCRFTDEEIASWTRSFTRAGGVVTFDVGPNINEKNGPIGTISDCQFVQLRIAAHALD